MQLHMCALRLFVHPLASGPQTGCTLTKVASPTLASCNKGFYCFFLELLAGTSPDKGNSADKRSAPVHAQAPAQAPCTPRLRHHALLLRLDLDTIAQEATLLGTKVLSAQLPIAGAPAPLRLAARANAWRLHSYREMQLRLAVPHSL